MSAAQPPVGADAVIPPRRSPLQLARLRASRRVRAGARIIVGAGVRVRAARGARIELGDDVVLGAGCRIEAEPGSVVSVGAGTRLGERSVVTSLTRIEIGEGCAIGDWALVADAEATFDDPEKPVRLQPIHRAPVRLEPGVRVGAHAAVLAGVTVGAGAVIGSYAVVRGDVPAGAVVTGEERAARSSA